MEPVIKAYHSFRYWLEEQLILQKLYSPLGFALLVLSGLALAYVTANTSLTFGVILFSLLVGFPVLVLSMTNTIFGLGLILFISVFMGLPSKFINLPLGTSLDIMLFILFFGLLIQQIKERDFSFAKSPISLYVIIWVVYNLLQFLNPSAESQMAWLFTVRSMGGLILLYFIACYGFKSLANIKTILKVILWLAFISALYGLKQEFFGFSKQEMIWLYSDPQRFELIFQWSRLRIFSFFSDPTNYGIYMSYLGTFCFILATGPLRTFQRIGLVIAGASMFLAMIYAGSRTPFVLLPLGMIYFVTLTLKRHHILGLIMFLVLGVLFVMKSTNSAVLFRVQSAFDLSKSDDTINVRLRNQKEIRPFIHSHPFGAGLGSTGIWGKRFTPNSKLADFAHDSGFVRIAVELGWIGLLLYTLMLFVIMKTSVYYYLRVKDPLIKTIYLGLSVAMFQLTIANYPQEALTVLPTSITFYIMVAMIVRLKEFDRPAEKPHHPKMPELPAENLIPLRLRKRNFFRHKS